MKPFSVAGNLLPSTGVGLVIAALSNLITARSVCVANGKCNHSLCFKASAAVGPCCSCLGVAS